MSTLAKPYRLPVAIIAAGAMSALLAMGLRASLGLYLKPMSLDLGWGREVFALAIALQSVFLAQQNFNSLNRTPIQQPF